MGCTSSAPNMADLNITDNTNDDKDVEKTHETKSDELTHDDVENEQNKTVLPMCDNLDENIHLSRNNSCINIPDQQVETVDHIKNNEEEHENLEVRNESQTLNELPSLKAVVNQVVLENIFQSVENVSTHPDNENSTDENVKTKENHDDSLEILDNEQSREQIEQEEIFEESVSPSQSECSRATRWEALADIAAELPPSLAVDPLTGQIYSLAK